MSRRAVLITVVVVAGLTAAAVPALRSVARWTGGGDVPVHEVRKGEFVRRVMADGNLEAVQATQLSPPTSIRRGVKVAWLAPDGSAVEEGEVVIRFDPSDMEKDLRDGLNERATSDSRMKQKGVREGGAIRNLERDAQLAELDLDHAREFQSKDETIFSRKEIIESEIDEDLAVERKDHATASRSVRVELAEVEQELVAIDRHKADLKIDQARKELQELEVRAPHEGIFVVKETWNGKVEVGSMVWAGNPVAEIPRLDEMEAKVFVLEADAGGLEVGLSAEVRLEAHPERTYPATVKSVDALAQRRNRRVPVQYFGVVLELESTDPAVMKPGQRVHATLVLDARKESIAVPRQAVIREEDRDVVFVARDGGFEPVEVKLGTAGLGRVVIEEGLEDGDVIALRDPTRPLRGTEEETGGGPAGPGTGS